MRVLYLIDNLGAGGAQRQVVELAARLAARPGYRTSVAAYRDLPDSERTDHLTDQYHHELLELGRELARLAAEADADGAPYYRHMATGVLEELAFDAGEDSEFCVRAYEELADLARDAGRAEDVDTFEEALQRLVDEKDG